MLKALRGFLVALLFFGGVTGAVSLTSKQVVDALISSRGQGSTQDFQSLYSLDTFGVPYAENNSQVGSVTVDAIKFVTQVRAVYLTKLNEDASKRGAPLSCTWQQFSYVGCLPMNPDVGLFYFHNYRNFGFLDCWGNGSVVACPATPPNFSMFGKNSNYYMSATNAPALATAVANWRRESENDLRSANRGFLWATDDGMAELNERTEWKQFINTHVEWNRFLGSAMLEALAYVNPNLAELQSKYGVVFNGFSPVDGGGGFLQAPPAGGGTGTGTGTGSTPPPTTCTKAGDTVTTTNQYDCAPKDAETSCTVLDIPCNLKKLFIPNTDRLKAMMSAQNLTQTLQMPTRVVDEWEFKLKMPGDVVRTFKIDFRPYIIPEEAMVGIKFVIGVALLLWAVNFTGIPNPLGGKAGGAGEAVGFVADRVQDKINPVADSNGVVTPRSRGRKR